MVDPTAGSPIIGAVMTTLPAEPQVSPVHYDDRGELRTAHLRLPPIDRASVRGTVVICDGNELLGLDPERPGGHGLDTLAHALDEALLDAGYAVVRADAAPHPEPDPDGMLATSQALLQAAFEAGGAGGRRIAIGLSAAAPLLAIAAAEKSADVMVLVAPPILEPYSNRPDRADTPQLASLGLDADLAAALGGLEPMSRAGRSNARVLIVHGAADQVVCCEDAIGWRASLAAAGSCARRIEIAFAGHDLGPDTCRDAAVASIARFITEES